MRIDEITQASLLYDFYGQLLPKRQREVMELYHEENLTLSEIAEEFGISRQGVHDALKNGEKALKEYEEKLGLMARLEKTAEAVKKIDSIIDDVIERLQAGLPSSEQSEQSVTAVKVLEQQEQSDQSDAIPNVLRENCSAFNVPEQACSALNIPKQTGSASTDGATDGHRRTIDELKKVKEIIDKLED